MFLPMSLALSHAYNNKKLQLAVSLECNVGGKKWEVFTLTHKRIKKIHPLAPLKFLGKHIIYRILIWFWYLFLISTVSYN